MRSVFFFLFFLFLFSLFIPKDTSSFLEEESFSIYIVSFEQENFTTKDLPSLFSFLRVFSIEPLVLPIHEGKIQDKFYTVENATSLFQFEKDYYETLKNLGQLTLLSKYRVLGIPLKKIEVSGREEDLKKLKKIYPSITYVKKYTNENKNNFALVIFLNSFFHFEKFVYPSVLNAEKLRV